MLLNRQSTTIRIIFFLEVINLSICKPTTNESELSQLDSLQSTALSKPGTYEGRGMADDHDMIEKPKSKPWLGYYDFLITEGSYKFWVVFELFTVALLIYSAFAALYYAKYTVTDYSDYDDYFFKRRSTRSLQQSSTFLGLPPATYLRIFEAISDLNHKFS